MEQTLPDKLVKAFEEGFATAALQSYDAVHAVPQLQKVLLVTTNTLLQRLKEHKRTLAGELDTMLQSVDTLAAKRMILAAGTVVALGGYRAGKKLTELPDRAELMGG